MATLFDEAGGPFVRSNRLSPIPLGDPFGEQIRGFGAGTTPPSTYDAEVRSRIGPQVEQMRAQMRAGGVPSQPSPAPAVSAAPATAARPSFGARLLRFLGGPLVTGAGLALAPSDLADSSMPTAGTPLDPQLVKRTGIPSGRGLTPEEIAQLNMTRVASTPASVPAPAAPAPVSQPASVPAPAPGTIEAARPVASSQPRPVVRTPNTYDANGNIVIDTARVGQVAAEERAIREQAFPTAARGARAVAAGGVDPYFAPFGALIDTAKELGAQRTANRAVREVAVTEAKARAEGAAKIAEKQADREGKIIPIETLQGKGAIVGDTYFSADAKGNLTAKRVPRPQEGLRPGLDPAVVVRDAKAAIAKDPSKRPVILRMMQENGYSTQGL